MLVVWNGLRSCERGCTCNFAGHEVSLTQPLNHLGKFRGASTSTSDCCTQRSYPSSCRLRGHSFRDATCGPAVSPGKVRSPAFKPDLAGVANEADKANHVAPLSMQAARRDGCSLHAPGTSRERNQQYPANESLARCTTHGLTYLKTFSAYRPARLENFLQPLTRCVTACIVGPQSKCDIADNLSIQALRKPVSTTWRQCIILLQLITSPILITRTSSNSVVGLPPRDNQDVGENVSNLSLKLFSAIANERIFST